MFFIFKSKNIYNNTIEYINGMSIRKPPFPQDRNSYMSVPLKQIRSRSLAIITEGESQQRGELKEVIALTQRIQEIAKAQMQTDKDLQFEIAIEREKMKKDLKEAYNLCNQKDQDCEKMIHDIQALDSRVGELNQQIHEMTKINQQQNLEIQEMNQNYLQLKEDYQKGLRKQEEQAIEISKLQEDKTTWMNKFQHLDRGHQNHIEELRKSFELEQRQIVGLELQKMNQKYLIENQERQRQELEKQRELQEIIDGLEDEKEQLIDELRLKEMDGDDMKSEIQALQKIELDNRKMCAHIQFLESKLESLVHDGQKNRLFNEEQRQKLSYKERILQDQITRLSQERDQLEQIRINLEEQNQSFVNEIHGMQSQIQGVRAQNEEYSTTIKILQEDLRNLQCQRQRYLDSQSQFVR